MKWLLLTDSFACIQIGCIYRIIGDTCLRWILNAISLHGKEDYEGINMEFKKKPDTKNVIINCVLNIEQDLFLCCCLLQINGFTFLC